MSITQWGIRAPACLPVQEYGDFVAEAERAGFGFVGMLDSQLLVRDPFVAMSIAAQRTSRLGLYVAATNPITRHITTIASAAVTLAELAPGRVNVVLGSGYSAVRPLGLKPATVDVMRTATVDLRRLVRGERSHHSATGVRLNYGVLAPPKVFVSAMGPRMIELAGEVADGVFLAVGLAEGILSNALAHLARGAGRSGRPLDALEIIILVPTVVAHSKEAALIAGAPLWAQYLLEEYRSQWLRSSGIQIPRPGELPEEMLKLFPDVIHGTNPARVREAIATLPAELLKSIADVTGVFGDHNQCILQLDRLLKFISGSLEGRIGIYLVGVDTYSLPRRELAAYSHHILPAFNSSRQVE